MTSSPEKKPARIIWPPVWGKPGQSPAPDAAGFLREVQTAANLAELTNRVRAFLLSQGVQKGTYHHLMPFAAEDLPGFSIPGAHFGYPEGYVAHYIENRYWEHDPLVRLVRQSTLPFFWSDIARLKDFSVKEREVLDFAIKGNLGEGICVPLFGPNGHNGYGALGSFPIGSPWPDDKIAMLSWAVQIAHLRVCELITSLAPPPPELSARESEILNWIARGKSNSVIAEIIGISNHTVDTYMRRIFEKLNVTDRTSAAIQGLILGLLK